MPHQCVIPHCPQYSVEQTHLISEEVTELMQKGTHKENSAWSTGRVLFKSLFCSQEGWRTMPNVANIQSQSPKQLCEQRTYQMESIYTEKDFLRKGTGWPK